MGRNSKHRTWCQAPAVKRLCTQKEWDEWQRQGKKKSHIKYIKPENK